MTICLTKIRARSIYAVVHAESFQGGPKFCRNRVTSQINLESAEGTTIIGWSGDVPRKNFAKLHLRYAFLCILEASFSLMLLRDLLKE